MTENINKEMKLPPQSVLITGASSGIGAALANYYAGKDIHLFLCGRNGERLQNTARNCREHGAIVRADKLDINDADAVEQWIRTCHRIKPLQLVVVNAGISAGISFDDQQIQVFQTNLMGALNTIHPTIDIMRRRHQGQIAIISSMAGLMGLPSAPAYSASKVAIKAYGEALHPHLDNQGVDLSIVCPGFVRSAITDKNRFPMPWFMEAGDAAEIIAEGLRKRRKIIAFPKRLWVIVSILASLPGPLRRWIVERLPAK